MDDAAAMTDTLTAAAILRGLTTRHLGRPAEVHPSVGSTNDLALAHLAAGAPHGALVVADAQTQGRGRRGSAWSTPPGVAVAASLVLRFARPIDPPTLLVAAVGLGIAEGLERAARVTVRIKWPNDLWIGERKVAGILVEARGFSADAPALVVGFGVNVNQREADFPADVRDVATSLALVTGTTHDRATVLRRVLEALEPRVESVFDAASAHGLEEAYRDRSLLLGRNVELFDGDQPLRGFVADLSARDGLLLRTPDGRHRHVKAELARDVRPV